jgi:hypothetical protein
MNNSVATTHDIEMDGKPIESPDKTLSSESDDKTKYAMPMVDCLVTSSAPNLPDPSKFPLLYFLGVCTTKHMDHLVQKIAKFETHPFLSLTEIIEKVHLLYCHQIRHLLCFLESKICT